MSRATIQINFENAKRQANELDSIASKLKQLADSNMENALNSVSTNWKSDNATSYLKKGGTVQANIKEIGQDLSRTATSIRKIAKATYDAEMTALTLAQQRKS